MDLASISSGSDNITGNKRYTIEKVLGAGCYGTVVRAYDGIDEKKVAIKRIPLTDDPIDSISMSREIRFLHALRSPNIVSLLDIDLTEKSLYIVTELFEDDLHKVIYSSSKYRRLQKSPKAMLSIMYQVLQALVFIHSEGVLHRDIKPANILIDSHFNAKLCDFGMARMVVTENESKSKDVHDDTKLTEYVVSRWYRAPEITLTPGQYCKGQDVWAAACTFAEMIIRDPLFQGNSSVHQIQVIVDILGKPSAEDLDFEMGYRARKFTSVLYSKEIGLESSLLPGVNEVHPDLLELLKNMLKFNPHHRITSTQACQLPIFVGISSRDLHFQSNTRALRTLAKHCKNIENFPINEVSAINYLLQIEVEDIKQELSSSTSTLPSNEIVSNSRDDESNKNKIKSEIIVKKGSFEECYNNIVQNFKERKISNIITKNDKSNNQETAEYKDSNNTPTTSTQRKISSLKKQNSTSASVSPDTGDTDTGGGTGGGGAMLTNTKKQFHSMMPLLGAVRSALFTRPTKNNSDNKNNNNNNDNNCDNDKSLHLPVKSSTPTLSQTCRIVTQKDSRQFKTNNYKDNNMYSSNNESKSNGSNNNNKLNDTTNESLKPSPRKDKSSLFSSFFTKSFQKIQNGSILSHTHEKRRSTLLVDEDEDSYPSSHSMVKNNRSLLITRSAVLPGNSSIPTSSSIPIPVRSIRVNENNPFRKR
eukprot:gene1993-3875_t